MTLVARPAKRSSAKPLIGFYDKSGGGKTLSALFLARGFVGPQGRIGMIESESGRGEAHCDTRIGNSYVGGFEVIPIWDHDSEACPAHSKSQSPGECRCTHRGEPYTSERYGAAISLAEQSRWDALIIDSASHEWEGLGGVLHAAEQKREAGAKSMQVWTQAKIDHQRHFIGRLLQTPIPLVILCMRAKVPMEEYVDDKGKKQMRRSDLLVPKQDHDILFEMFVHGHFDPEHRFHGTKYTRTELADVIRSGEPITNATGAALARWAAGDQPADLASVLATFKAAGSIKELQAAGMAAQRLPEADKGAAMVAYKERLEALKKAQTEQMAPEKEPGAEG